MVRIAEGWGTIMARATKPKDRQLEGTGETAASEKKIPPKQAVVIIHGMGEQRPMETLRSFVRAVWQSDGTIVEKPDAPLGKMATPHSVLGALKADLPDLDCYPSRVGEASEEYSPKRAWMAPDTRTGSHEIYRMTTAKTEAGYRVDFYELYWADIMSGSTLSHLRAWATGLLFRWPHHVPKDVLLIWFFLWASTIALLMIGLLAAPDLVGILGFDIPKELNFLGTVGPDHWLSKPVYPLSCTEGKADCVEKGGWVLLGIVVILILAWLVRAFSRLDEEAADDRDKRFGLMALSKLFGFALVIALIALFSQYTDLLASVTRQMLISGVAVVFILLINSFVVPYFGDVARYVMATPDTVSKRAIVRDRGLKLLRALHGVDENGKRDTDEQPYGRVTLVGHSLGSIIAYDLLMQFWAEAGPTKGSLEGNLLKSFQEMDAFLASDDSSLSMGLYHKHQDAISKELRDANEPWLITDFITLGSPLTHAEFLITENKNRFKQLIEQRLLSLSPPYPYEGGREALLYKREDGPPIEYGAHHATVFAATRWTNIFDRAHPLFFLMGDLISGPCRDNFGAGVDDRSVRIRRKRWFWPFVRIFTHTDYWNLKAQGCEINAENGPLRSERAAAYTHVGLLRAALRLERYYDFFPENFTRPH
jgi:hypothetical protein